MPGVGRNVGYQKRRPQFFQRYHVFRIFKWQPVGESNPSFQVENLAS